MARLARRARRRRGRFFENDVARARARDLAPRFASRRLRRNAAGARRSYLYLRVFAASLAEKEMDARSDGTPPDRTRAFPHGPPLARPTPRDCYARSDP